MREKRREEKRIGEKIQHESHSIVVTGGQTSQLKHHSHAYKKHRNHSRIFLPSDKAVRKLSGRNVAYDTRARTTLPFRESSRTSNLIRYINNTGGQRNNMPFVCIVRTIPGRCRARCSCTRPPTPGFAPPALEPGHIAHSTQLDETRRDTA